MTKDVNHRVIMSWIRRWPYLVCGVGSVLVGVVLSSWFFKHRLRDSIDSLVSWAPMEMPVAEVNTILGWVDYSLESIFPNRNSPISVCQGDRLLAHLPRWVSEPDSLCKNREETELFSASTFRPWGSWTHVLDVPGFEPRLQMVVRFPYGFRWADPWLWLISLVIYLVSFSFLLHRDVRERKIRLEKRRVSTLVSEIEVALLSGSEKWEQLEIDQPLDPQSTDSLLLQVERLRKRVDRQKEEYAEARALASTAKMASQVAHDVRAPLTCLESILTRKGKLEDREGKIVTRSISRIREITDTLLRMSQDRGVDRVSKFQLRGDIRALVEEIVNEKRAQLTDERVTLRTRYPSEPVVLGRLGVSGRSIDPTEFQRVISNLVDNGIEAVEGTGSVGIDVMEGAEEVQIEIRDSGKGIPKRLLEHLGQKHFTFGKEAGTGLGVYHACRTFREWGGRIRFNSQEGKGTQVLMHLPRNPSTALLQYRPSRPIFILSQDSDFVERHRIRFAGAASRTFSQMSVLEKELLITDELPRLLLDVRDLDRGVLTKLEKRAFYPGSIAIARSVDPEYRVSLLYLGILLMTENEMELVQFQPVGSAEPYEVALVDDSEEVRSLWRLAAQDHQRKLICAKSLKDLFLEFDSLESNSRIFIDARLESGIQGDRAASRLKEIGLSNVNVTTGLTRAEFDELSNDIPVVDKTPPWVSA